MLNGRKYEIFLKIQQHFLIYNIDIAMLDGKKYEIFLERQDEANSHFTQFCESAQRCIFQQTQLLQSDTSRLVPALKHVQGNCTLETEGVAENTSYINKLYGLFTSTKSL
jgi:hypothetical protein